MSQKPLATLATFSLVPILFGCFAGARPPALEYEVAKAKVGKWDQLPAFQEAVDPENFDEAKARAACFYATNEQRQKHGRAPLTRNALLEAAAQLHADRMTDKKFFSHEDPYSKSLRTPENRGAKVGIPNPKLAENIAFVTTIEYASGRPVYGRGGPGKFSYTPDGPLVPAHTYASLARDTLDGWMNSPGHRRNILDAKALELGCGFSFTWKNDFPSANAVQNFQLYEPIATNEKASNHDSDAGSAETKVTISGKAKDKVAEK